MVINLKQLYGIPGECLKINYKIEQSALDSGYSIFLAAPIAVDGEIVNRSGIVTLSYTVQFALDHTCDRCLSAFRRDYTFAFKHIIVRSLNQDDDEYVVSDGDSLDLDSLVLSDLLLQLPTKTLCKEDCKGLCSHCGTDLNFSDCGCEKDE